MTSVNLMDAAFAMKHRGPDGLGFAFWRDPTKSPEIYKSKNAENVCHADSKMYLGLAQNWLAIQDQSAAAQQPMCSKDSRYWIVFNGEIYNFSELKRQLLREGREFTTSSDTEVILALWEKNGCNAIEKLTGMFAFLLYDQADRCLWAARDRFGIKPLYYSILAEKGGVVFASEFRALFASGLVSKNWNEEALVSFLAAAVNKPDGDKTFFNEIKEVPAGTYLRIKEKTIETVEYYELGNYPEFDKNEKDMPAFKNLFLDVVEKHLVSVREVGTCLSGGLDSTNILYAVANSLQGKITNFKSFTIGSTDSLDYRYARIAAEKIGIRNHSVAAVRDATLPEYIELILACEVPNHTWGHINQYLLLKYINANFDLHVLLDGQGGDEAFSGYPWFFQFVRKYCLANGINSFKRINDAYYNEPPLRKEALAVSERMYSSSKAWVKIFEQGALKVLGLTIDDVLHRNSVRYYLNDDVDWLDFRRREFYRRELHHLLRQEDRLGMWFAIENRVPFLDHQIVEFAAKFDPLFLFKDGYLKYPLRILFEEMPEIIRFNHIKKGYWEPHFNVPNIRNNTIELIKNSRFLSAYIKNMNEIGAMNDYALWRFLQVVVLNDISTKTEISHWVKDNCGIH